MYHDYMLKVLLGKNDHNLPAGYIKNIELFHSNRIPRFTRYFWPYLQMPEHMHMGHFKYIETFYYMIERSV